MTKTISGKRCTRCGEYRPASEFKPVARLKDGLNSNCRVCDRKYRREHYIKNRERYLEQAREHHRRTYVPVPRSERRRAPRRPFDPSQKFRRAKYGITPEVLNKMMADQGGVCAICGVQPDVPYVDHDHVTGEVRGVLCRACNVGLGFFRDDPARMLEAVAYLSRERPDCIPVPPAGPRGVQPSVSEN